MNTGGIIFTICAVILIYVIIRYLTYNPNRLLTLTNGETMTKILASSLATNNSTPASNFTYSIWFYVNDWNYRYGEHKVIFGRMGNISDISGNITVNSPAVSGGDPCPVLVLGGVENDLNVSVGCYPGVDANRDGSEVTSNARTVIHTCNVSNIPIQKWVNAIVSVYNRSMDIYIDGKLVRTCLLPGIVKVNVNSDVIVTPNGGFDGFTSNLQYWTHAINPQEAWNIYVRGYGGSSSAYKLQLSLMNGNTTEGSLTI
jgi:hypothetical protein